MAPPGSSLPQLPSSATENPVIAVGRKVKSALSSHQRPSIRILRESSSPVEKGSAGEYPSQPQIHGAQGPESLAELSEHSAAHAPNEPKGNTFNNRFRSLFNREDDSTDVISSESEYDSDMVDLLDVVGMCEKACLKNIGLTLRRPRSIYTFDSH